MQQCTTELLDRNPAAIVLLDERKRIVYANRNADALHSDNDGIKLSVDGLSLLRKQDNDRLQRLIAHVLLSMSASSGGAMQAIRPSAKRPYVILVSPVARRYPALSTLRPAVCIVITDPNRQRPVSSDPLRAAFGLTAAEARLAAHLAAGEELRAAAEKLGITYGPKPAARPS